MDDEELLLINILDDLLDAEEQVNEDEENRRQRIHIDPFNMSDASFMKSFRLNKKCVKDLINLVTPFIRRQTRRSALSIRTKVNIQCL